MAKEKFNYQIVFKKNDGNRIVFAGSCDCELNQLLSDCMSVINPTFATIESVVYQPFKKENYETQKNS